MGKIHTTSMLELLNTRLTTVSGRAPVDEYPIKIFQSGSEPRTMALDNDNPTAFIPRSHIDLFASMS